MATGVSTKGVKFSCSAKVNTGSQTYAQIPDLQSFPDLLSPAETIEVTTLSDSYHRYIKGLKDTGVLEFGFLYDNSANGAFRKLKACGDTLQAVEIEFPDGTKFHFDAYIDVTINGKGVNEALTCTANCIVNSDIDVVSPTT